MYCSRSCAARSNSGVGGSLRRTCSSVAELVDVMDSLGEDPNDVVAGLRLEVIARADFAFSLELFEVF